MTEQKKPTPPNKHETRLQVESRPAGIAPSTYVEKPGGSVDMIEIVGQRPRVVRIAQGAYDGMVRDGTEFVERMGIQQMTDTPPLGTGALVWDTVFLNIVVPPGMALDLTHISVVMYETLDELLVTGSEHALPDYAALNNYVYKPTIDGHVVFDVGVWGVGGGAMFWENGWPILNQNFLGRFGDCPTHVVATEGQTFRVSAAALWAWVTNPVGTREALAIIRGRWIPIQHYRRIVGANSLE